MESIYKRTYEYYCDVECKTFTLDYNMDHDDKLVKSNKKKDLWDAGVQLWTDWEIANELYNIEWKDHNDLKKENKKQYKENLELIEENKKLKQQMDQQHKELQEIKAKLMELTK